jgi:hypothetical protein
VTLPCRDLENEPDAIDQPWLLAEPIAFLKGSRLQRT